jgi:hypothetical protein
LGRSRRRTARHLFFLRSRLPVLHGVFSPDGRFFYASEAKGDGEDFISVRDAVDFKVLGRLPSHAPGPHEIVLADGGKTLAVANGDGLEKSSLCFIEASSGKLLESYPTLDPNLQVRHVAVGDDGDFVVATKATRPMTSNFARLMLGTRGAGSRLLRPPEWVDALSQVQLLSLCWDSKSGLAVTTCPATHTLLLWQTKEERFLCAYRLKGASGIGLIPDGRLFAASAEDEPAFWIDPRTMSQVDEVPAYRLRHLTGSHLTVAAV